MQKRSHDVTPRGVRPPMKLSRRVQSPVAVEVIRTHPVLNCSFENPTPISKEKQKKINTLVGVMERIKSEIPAHENFIALCKKSIEDYSSLIKEEAEFTNEVLNAQNDPFQLENIEPCVPILAKDALDNFIKTKFIVKESDTELEDELYMLTKKHEKLADVNESLKPQIAKLIEECRNEIEHCDKKLQMVEYL